jgi:ribosomal protein S18 acetylase RimI-like enzyme
MNTCVRKALAPDTAALIALARKTISVSYRAFLGDRAVDDFLDSGAADIYVRENVGCCCWVVVLDDQIVGCAVCRDNLIDLMLIDPAFQRRGHGTELLHQVEELLGPRYPELKLESFEPNQPANAFYRKNGWHEARRFFDACSGVSKIVFQKMTGGNNGRT